MQATDSAVYVIKENRRSKFEAPTGKGLSRLDADTGKPRWNYALDSSAVVNNVVSSGDTVYLCLSGAVVHALDAATGQRRWKFNQDSSPSNVFNGVTAIATRESVYVGGISKKGPASALYALDAATGQRRWSYPSTADSVINGALPVGDIVLVGKSDDGNTVLALDAATGKRHWSTPGSVGDLTVAEDMVYLTDFDRSRALDAATGKERWRFPAGDPNLDPQVTDRTVYLAGALKSKETRHVYALGRSDGRKRWTYRATAEIETLWLPSHP